MINQSDLEYFCPLYGHDIAEGKCFDINYERLGYLSDGCLEEVKAITGKKDLEITKTCEACINLPFLDGLATVIIPKVKKQED